MYPVCSVTHVPGLYPGIITPYFPLPTSPFRKGGPRGIPPDLPFDGPEEIFPAIPAFGAWTASFSPFTIILDVTLASTC